MSIEVINALATKTLIPCPQCVKRACVMRDCVCGGFGRVYARTTAATGTSRKSEIVSDGMKTETEANLPLGLVKDMPFQFITLVGGVMTARPLNIELRRKVKVAILVRIDCEDVAWDHYNATVRFVLFDRHQENCRYECKGHHHTAKCRVIRDWKSSEEYCELVAKASSELWA